MLTQYISPVEAICSECNSELEVIGKKTKEVLKYVLAKLYIGACYLQLRL